MSHEIYIYISLAIAYLLQRPVQLRFQLSCQRVRLITFDSRN